MELRGGIGSHLEKAWLLYWQHRYDQAIEEVNKVLADAPEDPRAFALLGLSLIETGDRSGAEVASSKAIGLSPDWAYGHHARSIVLSRFGAVKEAEAAAREAVRLDSSNPGFLCALACVLVQSNQWQEARHFAENGLKHDPEHCGCLNILGRVLLEQSRLDEAQAVAERSLMKDAENAEAHSLFGWIRLRQGQSAEALDRFRSALRVSPGLEGARQGLVEGLKARHGLYRSLFQLHTNPTLKGFRKASPALWLVVAMLASPLLSPSTGSGELPWTVVIGLGFVAVLLLGVILAVVLAGSLFNVLVRFDRIGRFAMSLPQRAAADFACGLAIASAAIAATALMVGFDWNLFLVFGTALLLPPVSIAIGSDSKRVRDGMLIYTSLLAGLWIAVLGLSSVHHDWALFSRIILFVVFFLGSLASNRLIPHLMKPTATTRREAIHR